MRNEFHAPRIWSAIACTALLAIGTISAVAQNTSEPPQYRALNLLRQMTLDEKVDMLHGELSFGLRNSGIERLGIPALVTANGSAGVRIPDPDVTGTTQMPSGLALAATWNPKLARQFGRLAGEEAHSTGINVFLAPVIDIVRIPQWGRAFETYGEDPLLNGILGAAAIRGIQESPVISVPKHYAVYTQETNRVEGGNALVDERTLREIYIRPFAIAVRHGRPGAVMCSFNKLNGVYACENGLLLNDVLKGELNFQGWVLTDYAAAKSTVPSILAGLDQDLPGNLNPEEGPGDCFFCGPLLDAVRNGEVPEWRVNDGVLRILRTMFEHGLFDHPATMRPIPQAKHSAVSRAIAEQSMVLLKNDNKMLPFGSDIKSIAVIGADADTVVTGGGSSYINPVNTVSPLAGIRSRAGAGVTVQHRPGSDPVTPAALLPGPDPVPSDFLQPPSGKGNGLRAEYFLNPDFSGTPHLDRTEPYAAINGGLLIARGLNAQSPHFPVQPEELNDKISVRWSGQLTASVTGMYELALTSNGTSRLFVDKNQVVTTEPVANVRDVFTRTARIDFEAGSTHSVRIEFVNNGPQGVDVGPKFKFGWIPPAEVVPQKVRDAAELARNSQVAVVLVRDYSAEASDKPGLDLPNGQVQLIQEVAAANPRTVVVLTVGGMVKTSDWEGSTPAILHAWYGGQEQGSAIAGILFGDVNPSGRLPITIPVDEQSTPIKAPEQFPGDGLDQHFTEGIFVGYRGYEQFGITPQYPFGYGLSYTTFKYSNLRTSQMSNLLVSATVQNTGAVAGIETVQVYAGKLPTKKVDTSPKALAGWAKVKLQPGETKDVIIQLNPKSLSYWDVDQHQWVMPSGAVPIMVGASSADIRLTGELHVGTAAALTQTQAQR